MITKASLLVASGLLLLGAAPALADDLKPSDRCAFADQLRNWRDIDNHTAIVETGINRRYKVTFMNDCREMRYSVFAKVRSHGICLTPGDRIDFGPSNGFPNSCVVQSVEALPREPLTPAAAP